MPGRILVLAVVYLIAGRLALLLAIPPGYATAVWPAAGFALAGVLLYGPRVWPGVFLGSFLTNLGTSFSLVDFQSFLRSLWIPGAIGAGAALQAVVGAFLVRRFGGYPNFLARETDVLKFLSLGGPAASLVNATVGIATLLTFNAIPRSDAVFSWGTWWVGDTIGVLIFSPLVLIWAAAPGPATRRRQISVSAPLCVTFVLAVVLFEFTSTLERDRIALEFERRADSLGHTLKRDFEGHLEILHSIESFYLSSTAVSRNDFHDFVGRTFSRHPDLQALSWNPVVRRADRDSYERAARADGHRDFAIWELGANGELRPAADRAEYVTVFYIEPVAGNERALGFDVASDAIRRQGLVRARDSGSAFATGRTTLVQETARQWGFLVFLPIYKYGLPHATIEQRRENIQGFATAVFRVGQMLEIALGGVDTSGVEVRVYDASAPPSEQLLYYYSAPRPDPSDPSDRIDADLNLDVPRKDVDFDMAGRRWRIQVALTPGYLVAHRSWGAWTSLAGGLLFTGMLGGFLLVLTGRALKIEGLVTERTEELRSANEDLQRQVAERENTEKQLAEAQAIAHVGSWSWDIAKDAASWSDEHYRIFGLKAQEIPITFETFLALIHPQDKDRIQQIVTDALERRVPFEMDFRVMVGGEVRRLHGRGRVIVNGDATPVRIIGTAQDVTESRRAEERVRAALAEKEVLLKEVHHRVKNNLQVISSLFSLQSTKANDPDEVHLLRESRERVRAMALIHERLYQSTDLAFVDFAEYVRSLGVNLMRSHGGLDGRVRLRVDIGDISLPLDTALPGGLIVNELLSNALKYAFPDGNGGEIHIAMSRDPDRCFTLTVSDNGVGLPANFDVRRLPTLGLRLVLKLAEHQLGGNVDLNGSQGTRCRIRFPDPGGQGHDNSIQHRSRNYSDGIAMENANERDPDTRG